MDLIQFFTEEIDFTLTNPSRISNWLLEISNNHQKQVETINYIFCSDEHLLSINQEYLDHDYYTDIITFDNSTEESMILSDIFISIDRVRENASNQKIPFHDELHRVLAHGLLHLLGFKDKEDDEQTLMRQKEDTCLSLLKK